MGTGSVKGLILLPTLREQSRGPWVKQVDPSGSWLRLSACLAAAPRSILDPYSPKVAVQCVTVDTCMQIHTAGWDSPVPMVKAFVPSPSETLLHNSVISLAQHVWHDPHWCLHIDTLTPAVITVPQTWGSHPLSDLSHCIQTPYVHTHMSTHVHTQAREPSVIELEQLWHVARLGCTDLLQSMAGKCTHELITCLPPALFTPLSLILPFLIFCRPPKPPFSPPLVPPTNIP